MDIVATLQHRGLLSEEGGRLVRQAVAEGSSLDDALNHAVAPANGQPAPEQVAIFQFFSEQFLIPYVELEGVTPAKELLAKFPARLLLEHHLLPLSEETDGVLVATSRVFDTRGFDELRLATGIDLQPALAPLSEIDRASQTHPWRRRRYPSVHGRHR